MKAAIQSKANKKELFEGRSQVNKRMKKILPEHIKQHLWQYGTINYGNIRNAKKTHS